MTHGVPPRDSEAPVRTSLAGLAATVVIAAGLFTVIARSVATGRSRRLDEAARGEIQGARNDIVDDAVKPIVMLSLPPLVASATALLAYALYRGGREDAAFAIALTPVVAATVGESFTMLLPQQSPPDARTTEAGFPSGHTTGVTAEALAIAYILDRERVLSPAMLAALLSWPLVVSAARLYRDRHWTSDVLGGLTAGTAVAAAMCTLYEIRTARTAAP